MSLTRHLADRQSPVYAFFLDRFPNAKAVRQSLAGVPSGPTVHVTEGVPPLPAPGKWDIGVAPVLPHDDSGYPWPTVGTAFDYRLRMALAPERADRLVAKRGAVLLAEHWNLDTTEPPVFTDLADLLDRCISTPNWGRSSATDRRQAAQLSYALALFEQCSRTQIGPDWPLVGLGPAATLEDVLGLADERVLGDLMALAELAIEAQPQLLGATELVANPTFAASAALGGADADLIVDGRLLDIKTKKDASLERIEIWQLLAYVLADSFNQYDISEAGLYFARHGVQVVWTVDALMELLSGQPQELGAVRAEFWQLLKDLEFAALDVAAAPRPRFRTTSVQGSEGAITSISMSAVSEPTDRSGVKIKRKLTFRAPVSGKGKWHVAFADNPHVNQGVRPGDPTTTPSCGARSTLDLTTKPVTPKVGSCQGDWPTSLCGRCLYMTGPDFYVSDPPWTPTVGPAERWCFREPAKSGQRWHIMRADFYSKDHSLNGETSGICNAYGEVRVNGEVIFTGQVDPTDAKYCRHCLRMVENGGHKLTFPAYLGRYLTTLLEIWRLNMHRLNCSRSRHAGVLVQHPLA